MVQAETHTGDDKRSALEKALASQTFARSEQLRSFLRFVCEAEFRGESAGITEYVIGVEVLHRPGNYSPAEDSSVRTRAYELRQKLEKLYAHELPNETLQILIPKGAYTPQFVRSAPAVPDSKIPIEKAAPPEPPAAVLAVQSPPVPIRPYRPSPPLALVLAVALVAAIMGAAVAWNFRPKPAAPTLEAVVADAWSGFARHNASVLLMAATPLYLVLGPATHQAYGTPTYPAPPEAYPLFREHRPLAPDARLGMIFTNDALGVGSLNAVLIASNTIRALGGTSEILPERPGLMSIMHGRDAVLFGAPVDSQAIAEVLDKAPLSVIYEEASHEFVVEDRVSRQIYRPEKEPNGDFHYVYGLVTVLNTRESDHGRLGMLVFSGITSVGTHGAAEYFTSPRALTALREILAAEGVHGFPAAYQVVVKCRIENMLLVGEEYQAHRVLAKETRFK